MIVLKDKYKDNFLHSYSQEQLRQIKEQCSQFYSKYFEEK
jgi:hypothetical protein